MFAEIPVYEKKKNPEILVYEKKKLNKKHTQNPLKYSIWWPLKVQQCWWSSFLHSMKSSGYLMTIKSHS